MGPNIILSLATRLWGCSPEFDPVGDPKSKPNGRVTFEGEAQDTGGTDSYEDVQRDSGPPKDDAEPPPRDVEPEDAAPPREDTPVELPLNEPPLYGGMKSPADGRPGVRPNNVGQYEFQFWCSDPEGRSVDGTVNVWQSNRNIVNPNRLPPGADSFYENGFVTVVVPSELFSLFSSFTWQPDKCWDIVGDEAEMGALGDWNDFGITDEGVVHYWSFNGSVIRNGDKIIEDQSGMENDGKIFGNARLDRGVQRNANALWCDGVDDYVQTSLRWLGIEDTWTLSWWQFLNVNNLDDNNGDPRPRVFQTILTIGRLPDDPNNPQSPFRNFIEFIANDNNGQITLNYSGNEGVSPSIPTREGVLRLGEWQHVALAHSPNSLTLYLNGEDTFLEGEPGNYDPQTDSRYARYLTLCRELRNPKRYAQGRIDEFVIYNRKLNLQEVHDACSRNAPAGYRCQ